MGSTCAPAPAGVLVESLPCLFRNNCTGTEGNISNELEKRVSKLTPSERKRAYSIKANIEHLVNLYGVDRCGFLTLTFAEDLTWREAQKHYHSARTHLLSLEFVEFITVMEFTKRGRPHYHLVVVCKGDIRTGFNWEHYDAIRDWNKAGRVTTKPMGTLNASPLLESIWLTLRAKLPGYGMGRAELVPIKSTAEAIGYYVGGYVTKSLGNRKPEHKGARFVRYSQTCPRIVKGAFSWIGIHSWLWRAKLRAWATHHGCETMEQVAFIFGPRWAYHHKAEILTWPLNFYPSLHHAYANHDLGLDAEQMKDADWDSPLRITRTGDMALPPGLQTWRTMRGGLELRIIEREKAPWEIEEEKRQLAKHLDWLREKGYPSDSVGSSNSPSAMKGADVGIEGMKQEGADAGRLAKRAGGVGCPASDDIEREAPSAEAKSINGPDRTIQDLRKSIPRKYALRTNKSFPKLYSQRVML